MKYFIIIVVWFAIIVGDGTILSALTGLPAGFGIIALLSALAVTFGIYRWVIILGIVLAGITELMLGLYFGTIISAWLVIAWVWHILNRFLNINLANENVSLMVLIPLTMLGFSLFIIGEGVLWAISNFVYKSGLNIMTLINIFRLPVICIIILIELSVTIFILRFGYRSKNPIYAG